MTAEGISDAIAAFRASNLRINCLKSAVEILRNEGKQLGATPDYEYAISVLEKQMWSDYDNMNTKFEDFAEKFEEENCI